ncbi:rRNA maturation RNase YbeY [Psychroflexus sp. CAK57W]|uniref:rRNA maturation RNase YbeY n=1 Tax=Psychroflexus curvus TaxID=2873595 RepID=UPI001CC9AFF9|nr:rRNA maturation RNase YbeY [Psychroflexus curvus]MBZ9626923.1 rRNA maturation RNase YbeY [Psychroflexus curvus]MBZ9786916.1 rRNA maturation RNase YbeY [Psychroflexus curvus]
MESPINFYSKIEFELKNKKSHADWLKAVIESEQKKVDDLSYVFCSDEDLLYINKRYLDHDTFTDIITFDYSEDESISAEIYISIDRVKENAKDFKVKFENELRRVLVHGVLHCCGYGDSTEESKAEMRALENKKIELFHVEQK